MGIPSPAATSARRLRRISPRVAPKKTSEGWEWTSQTTAPPNFLRATSTDDQGDTWNRRRFGIRAIESILASRHSQPW